MDEIRREVSSPEPHQLQMNGTCQFLEADGSLVNLESRPEESQVGDELPVLLGACLDQRAASTGDSMSQINCALRLSRSRELMQ